MRIQCSPCPQGADSNGNFRYWVIDLEDGTPGLQYVSRPEGIGRGVLGTELDRAQVHYGDWIDCPREPKCQHCGAVVCDGADTHCRKCDAELTVNQSEDLAAVTDQRDRLLRGCKFLVSLKKIAGDFDGTGDNDFRFTVLDAREIKEAESAIADVEETR